MERLLLLFDASEAMNAGADWRPTRLLATAPLAAAFCEGYLDNHALASAAVSVCRDGAADTLLPLTTSGRVVAETLRTQVPALGASGAFSLDNAVRHAVLTLDPDGALASARGGGSGGAPRGPQRSLRALLITGTVRSIDAGDVFAAVAVAAAAGVRFDVVSLSGAPHVLQVLAHDTGGALHCPRNLEELASTLLVLAGHDQRLVAKGKRSRQTVESESPVVSLAGPQAHPGHRALAAVIAHGEGHETPPPPLPSDISAEDKAAALAVATALPHRCPTCATPCLRPLPTQCPCCGVVIMSEGTLHCAAADSRGAPLVHPGPETAVLFSPPSGRSPTHTPSRCGGCFCEFSGAAVAVPSGGGASSPQPQHGVEVRPASKCGVCAAPLCSRCTDFVATVLKACPACCEAAPVEVFA